MSRLGLVGVAALLVGGCADYDTGSDAGPVHTFEAQLAPMLGSNVTGTVILALDARELRAKVSAQGLAPGASVPQHVSSWRDCNAIGRAVINLDTGLTSPGEGANRGGDYPTADGNGSLSYEASRPVRDLAEALYEYRGMLTEELNLGNRTVILYDALRPVACGELAPT